MLIGVPKDLYSFLEPLKLSLDKKYSLNVIKEISVTDSFLTLDLSARGCQVEPYDDCVSRKYVDSLLKNCNCLPFQLRFSNKVIVIIILIFYNLIKLHRSHCVRKTTMNVSQLLNMKNINVYSNVLDYSYQIMYKKRLRIDLQS